MNEQNQQPMQIRASDADLKGAYSNIMQVAHTREEFVIDFLNVMPPAGVLAARVIVSPGHLKRMIAALEENLKRYEDQFGAVNPSDTTAPPKMGFKLD